MRRRSSRLCAACNPAQAGLPEEDQAGAMAVKLQRHDPLLLSAGPGAADPARLQGCCCSAVGK